jgi:ferredoxin
MDCVSVCPVNCFREGANMLVIQPDECIDCGVCVPVCTATAIVADTEPEAEKWRAINAHMARLWPAIVEKGRPPDDADVWNGATDKYALYFSAEPGGQDHDQRKVR